MTEVVGRDVEITWRNSSIPGCRQKSIALNAEPIDTSSDDSNGWRKIHSTPGEKQVDVDISGVYNGNALKADWFNNDLQGTLTLTYPNGDEVTGLFQLINYKETGEYKGAVTFDAQFRSSEETDFNEGT